MIQDLIFPSAFSPPWISRFSGYSQAYREGGKGRCTLMTPLNAYFSFALRVFSEGVTSCLKPF